MVQYIFGHKSTSQFALIYMHGCFDFALIVFVSADFGTSLKHTAVFITFIRCPKFVLLQVG